MTAESCFLHDKAPVDQWDLKALKLIYGSKERRDNECLKLCAEHLGQVEAQIEKLEKKVYTLRAEITVKNDPTASPIRKTGVAINGGAGNGQESGFLPPLVSETPSFYEKDREDNDGSLIE